MPAKLSFPKEISMRSPGLLVWRASALTAALLLAACGGAATVSTSSAPAASPAVASSAPGKPSAAASTSAAASAPSSAAASGAASGAASSAAAGSGAASAKPAASGTASGAASAPPSGIAPAPASVPAAPPGSPKVRLGVDSLIGDAPLWAAKDKGYFVEQGLDVQWVPFTNPSDELPALTTNQIDFVTTAANAQYYNASDRGVTVKWVANLAVTSPNTKSAATVVRQDLVDSGRYKNLADIKGMKFATGGVPGGSILDMQFNNLAIKAGISYSDLNFTFVPFPQMPLALANKAVDGAFLIEPFLSVAKGQHTAFPIGYNGELVAGYPVYTLAISPQFAAQQPAVADKFMIAFVKGQRFMYNAFKANPPQNQDEALNIIINNQPNKNKNIILPQMDDMVNPNTPIDLKPYQDFEDLFVKLGSVKQKADVSQMVDPSFMQRALKAAPN